MATRTIPHNIRPCKRGHTTGRYASGNCKQCLREWQARNAKRINERKRASRRENPAGPREWNRRWRKKNPQKVRELSARHYNKHKDKIRARRRRHYRKTAERDKFKNRLRIKQWREKNPERAKEAIRLWYLKNPWRSKANAKAYKIAKINAVPDWANADAIAQIYKNCPEGHHVDHIIPLRGESVCGLHVENNLQYLPAKENLAKRNRFVPL